MRPEEQLTSYRTQIDAIDEQIVQLMIERCGVVRQVGKLKAEHWPKDCYIRPAREGQMHRAIAERFAGTEIPPQVAITIWRQIIGAMTNLESPLSIAYDSQFPEHYWLAREYFSTESAQHSTNSTDEMLARIENKTSNILLLPADFSAPCWAQAEKFHAAGLRVFAELPAIHGALPHGAQAALALASIDCEPSGDDISLFFTQGHVTAHDGFLTELPGAIFLGAYPRPVSL